MLFNSNNINMITCMFPAVRGKQLYNITKNITSVHKNSLLCFKKFEIFFPCNVNHFNKIVSDILCHKESMEISM